MKFILTWNSHVSILLTDFRKTEQACHRPYDMVYIETSIQWFETITPYDMVYNVTSYTMVWHDNSIW